MPAHVIVAALLRDGDRVLLCHRSPTRRWYPNVWDFPGGHVEQGEQPADALRRELLEELGIDVKVTHSNVLHRIARPEADLDLTLFLVTTWSGTAVNLQADEHDAINWFFPDELSSLTLADESFLPILQETLRRG